MLKSFFANHFTCKTGLNSGGSFHSYHTSKLLYTELVLKAESAVQLEVIPDLSHTVASLAHGFSTPTTGYVDHEGLISEELI